MPSRFLIGAMTAAVFLSGCTAARVGGVTDAEPQVLPQITASPGDRQADDETPAPSPSQTEEASPSPTPSASPSPTEPPEPKFEYDVVAAQQVLADGGYYAGPIDGEEGAAMHSAVMAFQKVNGLGADGVVGPQTLEALRSPVTPQLRGGPSKRVEVDLSKQVLYYVEGDGIVRIMPISSGSGASYRTKSGGTARSLTPVGWFRIERKISGIREADLGILYDPMYFYKGWAIHGSNSVPAYPASHGCVRVTRWDAKWLFPRLGYGTQVYLYGGTHTFTAGSSAPGTDNPAGDTPGDTASPTPSPSPSPSSSPSPSGSPSPSSSPSPSPAPSQSPTPTQEPSPSPSGPSESPPPPGPGSSPSPS